MLIVSFCFIFLNKGSIIEQQTTTQCTANQQSKLIKGGFFKSKKVHLLSNPNSCILMLFLALPPNKKPLKCTHFQWFALLFINCKRRGWDSNP